VVTSDLCCKLEKFLSQHLIIYLMICSVPFVMVSSRGTEVRHDTASKSVCVVYGCNVSWIRVYVSIIIPVQMRGVCWMSLVPEHHWEGGSLGGGTRPSMDIRWVLVDDCAYCQLIEPPFYIRSSVQNVDAPSINGMVHALLTCGRPLLLPPLFCDARDVA